MIEKKKERENFFAYNKTSILKERKKERWEQKEIKEIKKNIKKNN